MKDVTIEDTVREAEGFSNLLHRRLSKSPDAYALLQPDASYVGQRIVGAYLADDGDEYREELSRAEFRLMHIHDVLTKMRGRGRIPVTAYIPLGRKVKKLLKDVRRLQKSTPEQ